MAHSVTPYTDLVAGGGMRLNYSPPGVRTGGPRIHSLPEASGLGSPAGLSIAGLGGRLVGRLRMTGEANEADPPRGGEMPTPPGGLTTRPGMARPG